MSQIMSSTRVLDIHVHSSINNKYSDRFFRAQTGMSYVS